MRTPVATTTAGLTSQEAARRLRETGPNVLREERGPSRLRRLLGNLTHLFALLLWAGAVLALLGGLPALSAAIVVVVIVNALFAEVQEHRAERAVLALRRMLPVWVMVRRDGVAVRVPGEEVVPGDLVLLAAGDRVCADADLVRAAALRVDESALTGESEGVEPQERVFAGTFVTSGSAEVMVTATGMDTRFGRIAALTQGTRHGRSPLERELDHVTRIVAVLSVGIGAVFFVVAGLLGMSLSDRFVFAIGVMVANVPEGLLPTVTLSLALATQRMAGRNALVRRLSAVETLGETTVICTDKTGTLTQNRMTVVRTWRPEGADPAAFMQAAMLCGDAARTGPGRVSGDPTEAALLVMAEDAGLDQAAVAAAAPRVAVFPFTAERRRMSTVHATAGGRIAYVKGGVEAMLPRTRLSPRAMETAEAAAAAMEHDALRVLALARGVVPDGAEATEDAVERDLELLGFVGIEDPPRPGVTDALRRCRAAGVRVLMVTGDSGRTAAAVAREIGLVDGDPHVITGAELRELPDEELRVRLAERQVVFARTDPEQKLRLARVLRGMGETVAMTGDGVNDAPALKEADIGVAMGSGTDVAKEAADIILLDDDFASVVAAVEEGRAVYDNIRRFTAYHFSSNVGELLPFLAWGVALGAMPLPLVVMQVLAIDLGTDMLPAIALGTERAEPGVMDRSPRPRGERLLNRTVLGRVYGWVGLWVALAGISSFLFAYALEGWRPWEHMADEGPVYLTATAMTFAGVVMGQVGAGLAMRTTTAPVRSVGLFTNRLLLVGIAAEISLVAILSYTPGLRDVFHMGTLGPWHWLWLCIWPPVVLAAEEARKRVARSRKA